MMKATKRSKQAAEFLKKTMKGGKALVVMHDNPDPDCLSSALCLRKIFEQVYKMPTTIGYGGVIGRAENRKLVSECGIDVERIGKLNFDDYQFVAVVYGQPRSGNVSLKPEMKVDMVIDHHPRRPATRDIPWVDIRTKYGATATICYEYCIAHNVELSKVEATALMYALKTETRDLGMESGPADRRAYMDLVARSDFEILFNIVHAKVTREYFQVLSRAMENAKVHNDVMITALNEIGTPEYVAEVADMLLRLKGVTWTMVTGRYQNALFLSIRTNDREANSGDVMSQVVQGIGSGGGHDMMAGGRIPLIEPNSDPATVREMLSQRLLKILRKRSAGSDLLGND
jgi:nanoRNase/pAp phosphatase (c-di-AMP/oligoRNAs hydrolase)